jgi:hypothetical protein
MSLSLSLGLSLTALRNNAGFTPASLFAGGQDGGWYDASDLSTLWQDAAGTTPVTTDGDPVGRIDDKSGNGNHLTQTTSSARPVFRESGGLRYLYFGGSQWLYRDVGPYSSGSFWLAGGMGGTTATTRIGAALADAGGSTQWMPIGIISPDTSIVGIRSSGGDILAQETTGNNPAVVQGSYVDIAAGDFTAYSNGVAGTTANNGLDTNVNRVALGALPRLTPFFYTVDVYQFVFRDASPSAAERADLDTFIAGKSGVTL